MRGEPVAEPSDQLVIVGAGGHGRELFDTVAAAVGSGAARWKVTGFVDDDPSPEDRRRVDRLGSVILGDLGWLCSHPARYALGIGSGEVRRRVSDVLEGAGLRAASVIHPSAHLGSDTELGDGVVVYDRCTVTTDVRIGRHVHLNVGCAVQHDSVLGDFVQLSPGVMVNGNCVIGDDVFLGTGAVVTRGCSVGAGARVGAGAVVLTDVPAGRTVVGVPARPSG